MNKSLLALLQKEYSLVRNISLGKSGVRVIGGIVALVNGSIIPLAVGIIVAEVGGVLEELVDER